MTASAPSSARTILAPPVFAALGMAVSYYGYPFFVSGPGGLFLFFGLLFTLVAAVSFLRVLRLSPRLFFAAPGPPPLFFKLCVLVVAAATGFSLGIASRRSAPGPVQTGIPAEQVIAVSGILREDPRSLQSGSGLGTLELRGSAGQGGLRASARGNLTVFFQPESIPRLKEFGRGSEIYADGILSYGSRGPVFRAVSVHVVTPAPAIEQFRTGLRTTLLEQFQSRADTRYGEAVPVWGALASALLLGMRDDLDTEFSAAFFNSGCSYILALSGMHLAVISAILAFLIRRPLGIRRASLVGAVFIVFYVFVAGSQPSLTRSAIMYLIGTCAVLGVLKKNTLSILSMAFIIQLVVQSGTGLSLSFKLSYLALTGMLTLGAAFHSLLRGRLPELVNKGLCASLGAFIATAPIVAFYFGSLRPIGIIAGLLAAPLCSLFMIAALGALAAAFLPLPLWTLFDVALTWLYRSLDFLVSLAGQVPGITVSNPVPVLAVSCLLCLLVLFVKKRDNAYRNSIASFT